MELLTLEKNVGKAWLFNGLLVQDAVFDYPGPRNVTVKEPLL
jgi:hypothetical protein